MHLSSPTATSSADSLKGPDRRRFPRSSQRYKARVSIAATTTLLARGRTSAIMDGTLINLSLAGALFSVDNYMVPNAPCSVEIYGAAGRVIPSKTHGRVVRTSAEPSGGYLSGVEFVTPLKTIKEPGKM